MAEQKKQEPTFYHVLHLPDQLYSGEHIRLERTVEFSSYHVEKSNLTELIKLSLQELQAKRRDGAAEEKTIFAEIQSAVAEWVERAAQTMLLDRAIEYVKTPEVKHTSNEWKREKDGVWEISNRVYVMRYRITQVTTGNHQGQWLVTWGIIINCPTRPSTEKYYYSGNIEVVEQKKKYYNAEADAQNYIQGRFDVYAHLFTELSPPVPDEFKRPFYINGVLLPGYTIAPKERAPQEVADELLGLLDDGDLAPPPDPEPPKAPPQGKAVPEKPTSAPKRRAPPAKKSAARKKAAAKKQPAPVR